MIGLNLYFLIFIVLTVLLCVKFYSDRSVSTHNKVVSTIAVARHIGAMNTYP